MTLADNFEGNFKHKRKVALHVDGGVGIGLGHATRGLALAGAFESTGSETIFLISASSNLQGFLEEKGHNALLCDPTPQTLLEICDRHQIDILTIDSYRFNSADFSALQNRGIEILVFEDRADRELPVDIAINGSPAALNLSYRTRQDTQLLLGTDYQIVRPEFCVNVERNYQQKPRSIFISIGGDDILGIFNDLLDFFQDEILVQFPQLWVDCVAGPFFRQTERPFAENIRIHHSPKDMRSLMIDADIAVSAGGQTLYELARCGVPTIAFCVGDDQLPNLSALQHQGCIIYIGWAKREGWLKELEIALIQLMNNSSQRQQIGSLASRSIDGNGAFRIVREVQHSIARSGR